MVKVINPPERRREGDVIYYVSNGIEHARHAYNMTDYGKIPPTSPKAGGYVNQRQQQTVTGYLRANLMRNFHRIAQTTTDRPDWHWNSGFSLREWPLPRPRPDAIIPATYFKTRYPHRNWFDSVTSLGIWHKWQEFAAYYQTARQWDLNTPEWQRFKVWYRQYCRWRWTPARFVSTETPDGEIDGDEVCALCFAIFSRAGYDTGDSQSGEPPDWCQYVVTPEGFWAANCFNFIGHGCRRCDCLNDGKLRYSNNPDMSVIPAPDGLILP